MSMRFGTIKVYVEEECRKQRNDKIKKYYGQISTMGEN